MNTTCPFQHAFIRWEKVDDHEPLGVGSCLFCGCPVDKMARLALGPFFWVDAEMLGLEDTDCWVGLRDKFGPIGTHLMGFVPPAPGKAAPMSGGMTA